MNHEKKGLAMRKDRKIAKKVLTIKTSEDIVEQFYRAPRELMANIVVGNIKLSDEILSINPLRGKELKGKPALRATYLLCLIIYHKRRAKKKYCANERLWWAFYLLEILSHDALSARTNPYQTIGTLIMEFTDDIIKREASVELLQSMKDLRCVVGDPPNNSMNRLALDQYIRKINEKTKKSSNIQ